MDHRILQEVILDQQEIIRKADIVPRTYLFEENANYVLVGLRRAGKSTLLYQRVREMIAAGGVSWGQIIYINFEDERLAEFRLKDFNDILAVQSEMGAGQGFFFFDEIQNVDGWEKFARRLADAGERVCITGSNAKMLSKEIESTLGGRYFTKQVRPYDFREYLAANGLTARSYGRYSTRERGRVQALFLRYMHFGGFPEALRYEEKREYLSGVYQKILLGDIVARHGIRNDQALRIMVKKLAESVRNPLSFTSLQHAVQAVGVSVSKGTVIEYMGYAEDSYLLFAVTNFAAKFAEREGNAKYYFGDNGLLQLFLYEKDSSLLENLTAICLHARYAEDLYYLKSARTGIDLDFYLPEHGMAVQVACSLEGGAKEREVEAFKKLSRMDSAVSRYVIVTLAEEERLTVGTIEIEVVPAAKLLLAAD